MSMKEKTIKALDWYGDAYCRVMGIITGPIVKPIIKRMGDPAKWTNKTIVNGLVVGVIASKVSIWATSIAFLLISGLFWVPFILFATLTIGWSIILIIAIVGLERAGIIKEDA